MRARTRRASRAHNTQSFTHTVRYVRSVATAGQVICMRVAFPSSSSSPPQSPPPVRQEPWNRLPGPSVAPPLPQCCGTGRRARLRPDIPRPSRRAPPPRVWAVCCNGASLLRPPLRFGRPAARVTVVTIPARQRRPAARNDELPGERATAQNQAPCGPARSVVCVCVRMAGPAWSSDSALSSPRSVAPPHPRCCGTRRRARPNSTGPHREPPRLSSRSLPDIQPSSTGPRRAPANAEFLLPAPLGPAGSPRIRP